MRQHVNLSQLAYNTIYMDFIACSSYDNISSFIGCILDNYYQSPEVSIGSQCEAERIKIEGFFEEFDSNNTSDKLNEAKRTFICAIAGGFAEYKLKNEGIYPNDITLKLYLKDTLANNLNEQREYERFLFNSNYKYQLSKFSVPKFLQNNASYIKRILEIYSRKSLYERHCVIYKSLFEQINNIEDSFYKNGNPFNVNIFLYDTTFIKHNPYPDHTLVKPYRITKPAETETPCLLCVTDQTDNANKRFFDYDCIPLSNIISFKRAAKYLGSGKLTSTQKKELDKAVAQGFSETEMLVSFTRDGLKKYINDTNRKPLADLKTIRISSDKSILLTVKGQAERLFAYFLGYGYDAVILSPKESKDRSKEYFKSAYEVQVLYSLSDKDWSSDKAINMEISKWIDRITEEKVSWAEAKDYFDNKNDKLDFHGIYPYFIKQAAEKEISDAFSAYADLLFEGIMLEKDYNLAGQYYSKVRNSLSLSQKYNLASIYINGLCKGHEIQEGKDILIMRNERAEPIFKYTTTEGYEFYAPVISLSNVLDHDKIGPMF